MALLSELMSTSVQHFDLDFTYSVIQVHINDCDYGLLDEVHCYFSFPRLGVTVPLRPGDFLLVNALEYHCLSSRCKPGVDLFCASSYLKTAIVGGNDNMKQLKEKEMECLIHSIQNKLTSRERDPTHKS